MNVTRRGLVCGGVAWTLTAGPTPPIGTQGDRLGDSLDERNFCTSYFAASFAQMPKFRSGLVRPTAPRALTDPGFQWTAGYIYANAAIGASTRLPGVAAFSTLHDELEAYPNGDAIVAGRHSPFSVQAGRLVITADRTPQAMRLLIPDKIPPDFLSGAINSYPFSQTYGYFEMRARVPAGRGLWPAFWLMPMDMSWPPENDVMEVLGHDPTTLHTTVHSRRLTHGTMLGLATKTEDLSRADHAFGVDWGPTRVRYYLDRRLVFSQPTPGDWHQPFYLLANLAVGGPKSWAGAPDADTSFPARFEIASICAWQRTEYA